MGSESQQDPKGKITRSMRAQIPILVMQQTASKKGYGYVYLWLWHHAGADDNAFPKMATLAAECSMHIRDVRKAVKWLIDAGWIEKHERPGKTSSFSVRDCDPSPKRDTPTPNGHSPKRAPNPSPKRGRATPPPNEPPNKNPMNKKPITTPKPPAHTASEATNSPQPAAAVVLDQEQDQEAICKAKAPADPFRSKTLPAGACPDDLREVEELLVKWWAGKDRGRTRGAFDLACKRLRDQPPELRAEMLTDAILSGWQGLFPPKSAARSSAAATATREQRREFMRRADQELKGRNIFELYAEQQSAKSAATAIIPVNVAAVS